MKMFSNLLVLLFVVCNVEKAYQASKVSPTKSDAVKEDASLREPKIKEFAIRTTVANHFAETTVFSEIENEDIHTKQITFSVVLPERAFISGFSMNIDGKIYNAYVTNAKEVKETYEQSRNAQSAAYMAVNTRNSNRFNVAINIEPKSKIHFNLTYEELLQRENGQYEIISNIQPGQLVEKLLVEVEIEESRPLLFVRAPSLRSGNNAFMQNSSQLDPKATIKLSNTSAMVEFHPDVKQQLQFACAGLGSHEYEGFSGQFVVQYEIQRGAEGSETLFQDGFFINYFAPPNLKPIPKHIVFVLDTSGSMRGTYIDQLKEGMIGVLEKLYPEDLISIVQYGETVYLWDLDVKYYDVIPWFPEYGNLASQLEEVEIPDPILATPKNIEIAKKIIDRFQADGGTNTIGALEVSLYLIKRVQEKHPGIYLPILIFLTDGFPSVGIEDRSQIISLVLGINAKEYNTPIYSLAFGSDADRNFLQELSLATQGQSLFIHVGNGTELDVAIQLRQFYETISSPVLRDVAFHNLPATAQFTHQHFPVFLNGSEIAFAGIGENPTPINTTAKNKLGSISFDGKMGKPLTELERIWAHLTIKQLLDESRASGSPANQTEFKKLALGLALNYNLVTNVTSLVVNKPNGANTTVNVVDASYGILPEPLNDSPMCLNVTNWIITNLGTFESTTVETATKITTEVSAVDTTQVHVLTTTTSSPNITRSSTTSSNITTSTTTTASTNDAITTSTDITTSTTADTTSITEAKITSTTDDSTTDDSTTSTTDATTTATTDVTTTFTTDSEDIAVISITTTEKTTDVIAKPIFITESPKVVLLSEAPIVRRIMKTCRDDHEETPKEGGCNPTLRPESCSLNEDKGVCSIARPKVKKWAYITKFGQCRPLWYSGCGGNDNRFTSKEVCERTCVNPTGTDRCKLPISANTFNGWCRNTPSVLWFYDKNKNECIRNWYSGCYGNTNRFFTKQECAKLCVSPKRARAIPQESCLLEIETGSCINFNGKWAFNTTEERCTFFWYGGCDGNANRFDSEERCKQICEN